MAAYPSIGLRHDIRPITRRRVDVSDAGDVRSVDLNETTVYRITITHPLVSNTDRATLIAFYGTNKNAVNTITLAGEVYDVQFESDYRVDSISSAFFDVSCTLVGVKQ